MVSPGEVFVDYPARERPVKTRMPGVHPVVCDFWVTGTDAIDVAAELSKDGKTLVLRVVNPTDRSNT